MTGRDVLGARAGLGVAGLAMGLSACQSVPTFVPFSDLFREYKSEYRTPSGGPVAGVTLEAQGTYVTVGACPVKKKEYQRLALVTPPGQSFPGYKSGSVPARVRETIEADQAVRLFFYYYFDTSVHGSHSSFQQCYVALELEPRERVEYHALWSMKDGVCSVDVTETAQRGATATKAAVRRIEYPKDPGLACARS